MKILDKFCKASGQKVNISKSKCFISKNVPGNRIMMIKNTSGIPVTKDLDMYLGIPLIHVKAKKNTFSHIVDKVSNKLTTWKANLMSVAGRMTLINSVSSAIPTYSMQMCPLPLRLCDKLNLLNINFLWGHTNENEKKNPSYLLG